MVQQVKLCMFEYLQRILGIQEDADKRFGTLIDLQ